MYSELQMYRERTFIEYLEDLRNQMLRISAAIGLITSVCMTFGVSFFNFSWLQNS